MRTFKHTIRDEQTNRCSRFCVQTARTRINNSSSMPLKILNFAFVLLGGCFRIERAKVATLPGLRIFLARIKSILSGFQFSDHDELLIIWANCNEDRDRMMTALCVQVVTVSRQSLEHMP